MGAAAALARALEAFARVVLAGFAVMMRALMRAVAGALVVAGTLQLYVIARYTGVTAAKARRAWECAVGGTPCAVGGTPCNPARECTEAFADVETAFERLAFAFSFFVAAAVVVYGGRVARAVVARRPAAPSPRAVYGVVASVFWAAAAMDANLVVTKTTASSRFRAWRCAVDHRACVARYFHGKPFVLPFVWGDAGACVTPAAFIESGCQALLTLNAVATHHFHRGVFLVLMGVVATLLYAEQRKAKAEHAGSAAAAEIARLTAKLAEAQAAAAAAAETTRTVRARSVSSEPPALVAL